MPISDASRSSDSGPPEVAHLLAFLDAPCSYHGVVIPLCTDTGLKGGRQHKKKLHKEEKQSVCS